jgi:hypothetical protein
LIKIGNETGSDRIVADHKDDGRKVDADLAASAAVLWPTITAA